METVILTIHLLLALGLIIVVLLQRSEGGGLGMGGGGGGGVMSGRAAATALSKVTWIFGIGFVVTSLALTVIAARQTGDSSVLDRLGIGAEAPAAPQGAPTLGEDLLPPTVGSEPMAPPAADAPTPPPPVE